MNRFQLRHACRPVLGIALAITATASMAQPVKSVPFHATLAIQETVAFPMTPPCFAIGELTGSVTGAPSGVLSGTSSDCINPLGDFDPSAPSYQFVSRPPGLVFQMGDGDQLIAYYSGTLTYRAGAPHVVSGYFILAGGTGRYRGATGGGTLSGFEDISGVVSATGEVKFNGKLFMPAGR